MEFFWVENMDDVIAQVLLSDEPAEETMPRDIIVPSEALQLPEMGPEASI
jgi:hypothetical protein